MSSLNLFSCRPKLLVHLRFGSEQFNERNTQYSIFITQYSLIRACRKLTAATDGSGGNRDHSGYQHQFFLSSTMSQYKSKFQN